MTAKTADELMAAIDTAKKQGRRDLAFNFVPGWVRIVEAHELDELRRIAILLRTALDYERSMGANQPSEITELQQDLDMLDGKPPYAGPENHARNDLYFATSLERKYGRPLEDLRRMAKQRKP